MAKIIKNYRIDESLFTRFDDAAAAAGVDKTSVILEAIQKFVDNASASVVAAHVRTFTHHIADTEKLDYLSEAQKYDKVATWYAGIISALAQSEKYKFNLDDLAPIHKLFLDYQTKYLGEEI